MPTIRWSFDLQSLRIRIRQKITFRGLSRNGAAEEIGIDKSTMCRMMAAQPPNVETFIKICKWLNEPLDTFVKREYHD